MLALLLVVLPVLLLASLTSEAARRVLGAWLVGSAAGVLLEVLGALVLGRLLAYRATAALPKMEAITIVGFAHAMGGFLMGCYLGGGAVAAVAGPVLGCRVFQSGSPRQRWPAVIGALLGGLVGVVVAVIAGVAASLSHQSDLLAGVTGGGFALVTLGAVVGWSLAPPAGTGPEAKGEPAVHAARAQADGARPGFV